jgi:hypothetical protein
MIQADLLAWLFSTVAGNNIPTKPTRADASHPLFKKKSGNSVQTTPHSLLG